MLSFIISIFFFLSFVVFVAKWDDTRRVINVKFYTHSTNENRNMVSKLNFVGLKHAWQVRKGYNNDSEILSLAFQSYYDMHCNKKY